MFISCCHSDGNAELGELTKVPTMKRRAPMPAYEPRKPRSFAILIRRLVVLSPGRPLVLLIFESMVSAGWETMAAAKPAIRPEPRLMAVLVPPETVDLSTWR